MTERGRGLEGVRRGYRAAALLAFNAALAFVAADLLAWPVVLALRGDPITTRYGRETVLAAYPHRAPDEVDALLRETWDDALVYRPFLQAGDRPRDGRFVNVDEHGFRHTANQAPWPPTAESVAGSFVVFVFGGSTAFGHGVADDETFGSFLQEALEREAPASAADRPVALYNFAAAGYYSSHERILLGELLAAGHRPDAAVFLDGLNDFYFEEPQLTDRLERLTSDRPLVYVARLARRLHVLELALRLAERGRARTDRETPTWDHALDDGALLDGRIERYLSNVRQSAAVAREHGFEALFVVQPVPTHGYELDHHPFARWTFAGHSASHFGYPRLRERLEREPPTARVLWAGDLLRGRTEPLFVDQVHYGPLLARELAQLVAAELVAGQPPPGEAATP
jgi:hypothetical protein